MSSSKLNALVEAIENDNQVAIKKLLDSGIDLNSDVVIGAEYEEIDDPDEIPLLFFVIMKGVDLDIIKMLIDAGMKLDYYTKEGLGAVDVAIKYRRSDIVKLCKEKGIDIVGTKRKSGMTPLMLAASFSDYDMVDFLLKEGANLQVRDRYGMRAIDYAAKMGQKRMKEYLEKRSQE